MASSARPTPTSPAPASAASGKVVAFPPERLGDAELVDGVGVGDGRALGELYRRYAPMVQRLLRLQLGSDAVTEDLVQEVFLSLWRTAPGIREPGELRAYLSGAAVRAARMERRRLGRQRRWLGLFAVEPRPPVAQGSAEAKNMLERVQSLLKHLKPREQEAFVLRYVEDLSPAEIAQALGVSLATAKRDIAQARDRLLQWVTQDPQLLGYVQRLGGERGG